LPVKPARRSGRSAPPGRSSPPAGRRPDGEQDERDGRREIHGPAGAQAADQYALLLAESGLTPPLAGIMRMLTVEPGLSQQQLAEHLHTAPSRIVSYVDDLEARGWLTRARDPDDRRINVLTLTEAGRAAFASIGEISRAHDARFTEGLSDAEHAALGEMLARLAAARA